MSISILITLALSHLATMFVTAWLVYSAKQDKSPVPRLPRRRVEVHDGEDDALPAVQVELSRL
jgi:hypothetical protein